MTEKQKSD